MYVYLLITTERVQVPEILTQPFKRAPRDILLLFSLLVEFLYYRGFLLQHGMRFLNVLFSFRSIEAGK